MVVQCFCGSSIIAVTNVSLNCRKLCLASKNYRYDRIYTEVLQLVSSPGQGYSCRYFNHIFCDHVLNIISSHFTRHVVAYVVKHVVKYLVRYIY